MQTHSRTYLVFLFFILFNLPIFAGNLEDADERLFQVQLTLAQKGDARAQYYLGEMHEQGLGTKQNANEAFKWYAKAAEGGDPMAKRKLSLRPEIESEIQKDQAAEAIIKASIAPVEKRSADKHPKAATVPAKKTVKTSASAPVATVAQADDEEAKRQQQILEAAVAREKRRAKVRAMILERMRHPVGAPFE